MIYQYQKTKIFYDCIGEGPPFILLHGWGVNSHTFDYLVNNLKSHFSFYLIDLPGFGQSEEPNKPYRLNDYIDFISLFIEELQINNPIILGHSFGGRIAIKYASRNKNLSKLILVDSAGIKRKLSFQQYLSILKYKFLKYYYKKTKNVNKFNQLINTSGSNDFRLASNIMKATLIKVVNEDLKKYLKKIDVETLIIWGKDDKTTPYKDAKLINKLIKNSGLVTLENTGHFPYLEKKNYFLIILKKYLGIDN